MIYVAYRHGGRIERHHATLGELLEDAVCDFKLGEAAFDLVLNDDGSVALDKDALRAAIFAKCDEQDMAFDDENEGDHPL